MKIEQCNIGDVVSYKNNPRVNKKAVSAVVESIRHYGWRQPIVTDENHVIIVGETRFLAAKQMRLKTIPVHVAVGFSEEQARAYRIADNRTGEFSEWDVNLLASELKEIDMAKHFTGFDNINDVAAGLAGDDNEPEVEFTEELLEEHNYVVLYFDNEVDWLQAETLLGLKPTKALNSKEGYTKIGVGRVLRGSEAIKKIQNKESDR